MFFPLNLLWAVVLDTLEHPWVGVLGLVLGVVFSFPLRAIWAKVWAWAQTNISIFKKQAGTVVKDVEKKL